VLAKPAYACGVRVTVTVVADGYEVDPATLRAGPFYEGADSLGDAATVLSVAQLVPGALGEVEAAYELAAAFAAFVGAHGEDLRRESARVSDAADGLVASATTYRRLEEFP
jgi:hypothetical protein